MKPSGFGIIELLKTIILPEAHAMNKSITQATQNDKQISKMLDTTNAKLLVSY